MHVWSSYIFIFNILYTLCLYINIRLSHQAQLPALMGRGWLHLSLPPLVLTWILYSSALSFHLLWCVTCATLSMLSIFSHHIRDGVHHGLDFYPLGTTPVLPYWLYIVLTLILPIVTSNLSVAIIQQLRSSLASPSKNLYVVWIVNNHYHLHGPACHLMAAQQHALFCASVMYIIIFLNWDKPELW